MGPFMVEIVYCRVTRRGRKKKKGMNKGLRDNMRNDGPGIKTIKLLFPSLTTTSVTRLFFNILPFTAMGICPMADQICQSRLKVCQILNNLYNNWQKLFKVLPKWRKFAKSGHTADDLFNYGKILKSDLSWLRCLNQISQMGLDHQNGAKVQKPTAVWLQLLKSGAKFCCVSILEE